MSDKKRLLSAIGTFFKNAFTQNIPLKVIALLFAFLLWGYVLTIENPEYAKVVRDVEISMVGETSLTNKGLMLVSRELGTTDVTVLCEIGKHSELDASRLSCTVDLSSRAITLAEDEDSKVFPLTVTTVLQNGYGTVTAVEHSTVNVEVARIATRSSLPVAVEYTGALPVGFQITVPDRLTIAVSGMKSLVDQISKGVVTVDLSAFPTNDPETLAGTYSGVYPVQFYNSSNVGLEDIYNDNGESYTIDVPLTIRAYRDVEIAPVVEIDDGLEYRIVLSRSAVRLYGSHAALQALSSIRTEPIVATNGMDAEEIETRLVLPESVTLPSGDSDTVTATLTVTETVDTREFAVPITYRGIGADLLRVGEFPTELNITATGTLRELDAFATAYVTLTVDLTGCGAGSHTLPVLVTVDQRAGDLTIEPVEANVTLALEAKPVETPALTTEG